MVGLGQGRPNTDSGGVRAVQHNMNPDDDQSQQFNPGSRRGGHGNPPGGNPEDPDVLRDLVQQARGVPLDVQKITGQEIRTLRTTSRKESTTGVALTRAFTGLFSGIFAAIGGLFSFGGGRKRTTQCDIYGHVRPKGAWEGTYPRCVNCGVDITSEDMLRGSTAKQ